MLGTVRFSWYTTLMRRFLLPGLLGLALAILFPPETAFGADPWCLISNLPPCGGAFAGQSIFQLIQETFINTLRYAVVAMAFGMFVYYAFSLLFLGDDENATTQMKTSFSHAIVGCAIISIAALISDALAPTITTPTNPLSGPVTTEIQDNLNNIIQYIKLLVGILVSFHVTYQGIRLIALQGKEEEVTKQKAKFFHGLIGVAVVLLASSLVTWATPQAEGGDAAILSQEIQGIANFLITLFGLLAVVAFIASAAVLLLSIDEGGKEKGKKGMLGSVVVLVIVFSSWAIINYVLGFR